jgi:hypothetical protein
MSSLVILSDEMFSYFTIVECRKRYEKWVFNQSRAMVWRFSTWGFNNYQFFKTIVLRFYPDVNEKHLREFYAGTVIREDVLKYVGYTYQILNV